MCLMIAMLIGDKTIVHSYFDVARLDKSRKSRLCNSSLLYTSPGSVQNGRILLWCSYKVDLTRRSGYVKRGT